jgi:CRISPR-associated endonuclease Cas1/CRISPR-associated protein Cas4
MPPEGEESERPLGAPAAVAPGPAPQRELGLAYPEQGGSLPLIPVRMVNEYVYCPRLAYLEWVQGEWADSSDTVEGRHAHRRVDVRGGSLPQPDDDASLDEKVHARSVDVSSERLGLVARIDLIEGGEGEVVPVDYKRGKRPHVTSGAYAPERIQVCAQGLILRDLGYRSDYGVLYFAGSRERVRVEFDDDLVAATLMAINGLRLAAAGGQIPPPLDASPKCVRCSLNAICLPDETSFFRGADIAPRPLFVGRDQPLPVYVQAHGAKISKNGEVLEIRVDDKIVSSARLMAISQLAVSGGAYLTTPALHELMRRDIPVTWQSYGGWFLGHVVGTGHRNVELRTAQYRASFDRSACLRIARELVAGKVRNCRGFLRRNWKAESSNTEVLAAMDRDLRAIARCGDLSTLLGYEGASAARYFEAFPSMLRMDESAPSGFDFQTRNRRPPTDPVNAMLSYAYALLVRTISVTLSAVGFDIYRGFYHQPRYGRPALALDMMEPFRPLLADSVVVQVINNGEVGLGDFLRVGSAVNLTPGGRKSFIKAYERRLEHEITHPLFGYRLSYRRLIELQCRLLARHLLGEIDHYPAFTTR